MKNILIVGFIVVGIGYMFVLLADKYETIKSTNTQIEKQKNK